MTTATGDLATDFSGLANANPYTPPKMSVIRNSFEISGGLLLSTAGSSFAVTTASPTSNVVKSSIEVSGSQGDAAFAVVMNSSGNGFGAKVLNSNVRIITISSFSGTEVTYASPGVTNGDLIEIAYDQSANQLTLSQNGAVVSTYTPTAISGLKAGLGASYLNANTFGIASWAASGYAPANGIPSLTLRDKNGTLMAAGTSVSVTVDTTTGTNVYPKTALTITSANQIPVIDLSSAVTAGTIANGDTVRYSVEYGGETTTVDQTVTASPT